MTQATGLKQIDNWAIDFWPKENKIIAEFGDDGCYTSVRFYVNEDEPDINAACMAMIMDLRKRGYAINTEVAK